MQRPRFGAEERSHQQRAASLQGPHGSSAGRDRRRAGLAHRGAADGGRRRARPSARSGNVYTREQAERARAVPRRPGGAAGGRGARLRRGWRGSRATGGESSKRSTLGGQRAARLEIDRELAVRKGRMWPPGRSRRAARARWGAASRSKADKVFDRTLEQEVRAEGHELPASLKPTAETPELRCSAAGLARRGEIGWRRSGDRPTGGRA